MTKLVAALVRRTLSRAPRIAEPTRAAQNGGLAALPVPLDLHLRDRQELVLVDVGEVAQARSAPTS